MLVVPSEVDEHIQKNIPISKIFVAKFLTGTETKMTLKLQNPTVTVTEKILSVKNLLEISLIDKFAITLPLNVREI